MNLEKVEHLDVQDGDIVILRVSDANNQELRLLFQELAQIKQKQQKNVHYLVFPNSWSKLVEVQIQDIKGRIFQRDKLVKQLIRIEQRLINKFKVECTPDAMTEKFIQNLEYIKSKRGV